MQASELAPGGAGHRSGPSLAQAGSGGLNPRYLPETSVQPDGQALWLTASFAVTPAWIVPVLDLFRFPTLVRVPKKLTSQEKVP